MKRTTMQKLLKSTEVVGVAAYHVCIRVMYLVVPDSPEMRGEAVDPAGEIQAEVLFSAGANRSTVADLMRKKHQAPIKIPGQ